jgi:single-stranded-DNA-specific exonuclease
MEKDTGCGLKPEDCPVALGGRASITGAPACAPTSGDWDGFFARCKEVADAVGKMHSPLVVNHYDCDGLTSGAIAAAALEKMGKNYRIWTVRKVDDEVIAKLKDEKEIIFTDLGGGSAGVDALGCNAVIIDHHQTEGRKFLQVNPHLFGFDGGSEVSAAGVAYCVFRVLPEIALVGAWGDVQYPFASINQWILEQAEKEGVVKVEKSIRLFGRVSRPLAQMLSFADEPYLPGLTGNEERCMQFCESLGFPLKEGEKWRTYHMLNEGEKKKFVSSLAEYLAEAGYDRKVEELVGESYLIMSRPQETEMADAGEFSTLLNACGRNNQAQLGIDVCLGRKGAYESARALLLLHRKNLREGISFAQKNTDDFGKFLLLDGRGVIADGIIGVVAGMLYSGERKKPILAIAIDDAGLIKISMRGTKELVQNGLNLGAILHEACAAVGGIGGGHKIAAGGSVGADRLDEFLLEVGKRI